MILLLRMTVVADCDVFFQLKPTDIRLDGTPVELKEHNYFTFGSLLTKGEVRRLSYTKTNGERVEMEIYPEKGDSSSRMLAILDTKFEGNLRYRIITSR